MRTKTKIHLICAIIGIILMAMSLFLETALSKIFQAILTGLGSGAFGMGAALFTFGRWEESQPEVMKQNEIEAKDERNLTIRYRAQALSGLVVQWLLIAVAWICIIMNGPLWVILTTVGIFLGKSCLEFILIEYYQRKM